MMGRVKRPGKTKPDDPSSWDEGKFPGQTRKRRPQKIVKDEGNEDDQDESKKLEEGQNQGEDTSTFDNMIDEDTSIASIAANTKKRKRNLRSKERSSLMNDESHDRTRKSVDKSSNSNGFRHLGRRRKGKPCRAAQVGIESNWNS